MSNQWKSDTAICVDHNYPTHQPEVLWDLEEIQQLYHLDVIHSLVILQDLVLGEIQLHLDLEDLLFLLVVLVVLEHLQDLMDLDLLEVMLV